MRPPIFTILLAVSLCSATGLSSISSKCTEALLQNDRKAMALMEDQSKDLDQILSGYFADPANGGLKSKDGQTFIVTLAGESDVEDVTELIHLAFEVWKTKGLDLSPMHQTPEQTRRHLSGKGLVLKDSQQKIIGTVSFDIGIIETSADKHLFYQGAQEPVPYLRNSELHISKSRFLILKKLAVHPGIARSGLGRSVLKMTEKMARDLDLDGVLLETVRDADWLYDWYANEEYQTIGFYTYPSRPLETVLMVKV